LLLVAVLSAIWSFAVSASFEPTPRDNHDRRTLAAERRAVMELLVSCSG
jgi:hypothetical protein